MASKDPRMSKQGTAGKRKPVTVTVAQKFEIIRRLESGESCSVLMASSQIGLSTLYYIGAVAKRLPVRT
jgi:hypothetical protein